jgi:hypothetical protein
MSSKYFVIIEGTQQGPFSLDELRDKNIHKNTLVWTASMDNWTEAFTVDELKDLIKIMPPPIPPIIEKPIKVEAEIIKKKGEIISPKIEVALAKETKNLINIIIYGLIIGVISFPVFYFVVYQTDKYDNFDIQKNVDIRENTMIGINTKDFPFDWGLLDYPTVKNNIERRKEIYTNESINSSIFTFIISSCILIIYRYISRGAKWVNEMSNKDS